MSHNTYPKYLPHNFTNYLLNQHQIKVFEHIGEGLNSNVYRVIKIDVQGSQYALKVYNFGLKSKNEKDQRLKMQYEIQVSVLEIMKKEKGIIKIYQHGLYEEFGFVLLELMKGGSMRDLCNKFFEEMPGKKEQQEGRQNDLMFLEDLGNSKVEMEKISKNLLAQLVLVLQKFQDYGIIHHDLKLQNVMLDNRLNLKIIDFGTVHIVQTKFHQRTGKKQYQRILQLDQKLNSKSDYLIGTKHYICPELISGKRNRIISNKIDIWSYGIIAYCIFCGRYPFETEECKKNSGYFHKICSQQLQFPIFLSQSQIQLLRLCLQKNPNHRPNAQQVQKLSYFSDMNWQSMKEINETFQQNQLYANFSNPNNDKVKPIFQLTNGNIKYYKNKQKKGKNYQPVPSYTNFPQAQQQKQKTRENADRKIKKYRNVDISIEENERNQKILRVITKSELGTIKLAAINTNALKIEKINEKELKLQRKCEQKNEKTDEFELKFSTVEQMEDFMDALIKNNP